MRHSSRFLWLLLGIGVGAGGMAYFAFQPRALANNDRHEDYIITTGPIATGAHMTSDGVWLLDYRAGKLLGTIVDRLHGKVTGWAEVDLIQEFNLAAKQNVHFLMTTGSAHQGQSALYITEINSGRFGVYTLAVRPDGRPGIRRYDATTFRPQN